MAKSTITQVYSQIDSILADNTVGAITPEKLRGILKLLGDTLKPSFSALTSPNMDVTGISGTPKTLVSFASKTTTDTSDSVADIATGKITRADGGSTNLALSGTILTTNSKVMTISLLRGTTAIRTQTFTTTTTAMPFYIAAPDYFAGLAEYSVVISGTSTTATLGNLLFTATSSTTL